MELVALAGRARAWHRLDPRRPRGHDRRRHRRAAHREGRARDHRLPARPRRNDLRGRRRQRRALLGLPHRPLRPQEALSDHARRLPRRDRRHGLLLELRQLRPLPLLHRVRHRRRVRGDQLGDRRAHPGACAGLGRPHHQRELLARRRVRGGGHAAPSESRPAGRECRLAAHLRDGRRNGARHPPRAPERSREPALARAPRTGGRGRAGGERHRGAGEGDDRPQAAARGRGRDRAAARAGAPASGRSRGPCSAATRGARSSASR